MVEKYVSTRVVGYRNSAGIGYVVIPPDIDRTKYIDESLKSGKLSLLLEDGGVVENCIVSKNILNDIEFPKDYNNLGSMVAWVNKPKQNTPIIVSVLQKANEVNDLSENQMVFRRNMGSNSAEVSLFGKLGSVLINAKGSTGKSGRIDIVCENTDNTAQVNLIVKGNVKVKTSDTIVLETNNSFEVKVDEFNKIRLEKNNGFLLEDSFGNEILSQEKGFSIRNKNANLKNIINDLLDLLTQSIVQTPSGVGTFDPQTIKKIAEVKSQFNSLME